MEFPAGDVVRATRFWSGVLDWLLGPEAGVAVMPGDEPGHPNVYIETGDLDAALQRVRELGGTARPPDPA